MMIEELTREFEKICLPDKDQKLFNIYMLLLYNVEILKRPKFSNMTDAIVTRSLQLLTEIILLDDHEHLKFIIEIFLYELNEKCVEY